ncbi:TPA: hypothetical protein ACKP1B_001491 [Serratia fonticola]
MIEQPAGKRISELPRSETLNDVDIIPAVLNSGEAFKTAAVSLSALRQLLNFDNAKTSVEDGLLSTKNGQIFHVWGDEKKTFVNEYINNLGEAVPTGFSHATFNQYLIDLINELNINTLRKITAMPDEEGIEFAITDIVGRLLLGLTSNGDLKNKTTDEIIATLSTLAEKIGTPLQIINSGINDANVIVGYIDKNNKLIFGITPDAEIVSPTVDKINSRLDVVNAFTAGPNDYDLVIAWIDSNNKILAGIKDTGELFSPTIDDLENRLSFVESVTGSRKSMRLCGIYGQSNTTGAVDVSQVWRTPAPWGVYPEGYDGPLDGDAVITNQDNGVYTLSSDRSRIEPLKTTAFGVIDGDGPVHGAFDTTKKHYPQYNYLVIGHGRGSSSIEQLDRPTPEEITAGDASGITIPTTSVEYQMMRAGHRWDKLPIYRYQDCATPYYRGMWLFSHARIVCANNGYDLVPDVTLFLQGENNADNPAGYSDKQIAFYDQYTADIKEIFSYTGVIHMIIEQSNYSWTSVTNEQQKVNNHFELNIEQMKTAEIALTLSPARHIYLAAPRYPLTSNIHLYPHAQRAHGEQLGKVYRKVSIEQQGWNPFGVVSWWLSGNELFIKLRPPVAPLQFAIPLNATSHEMRTGKPYGFSYSGGNLTLSDIEIVGRDIVKIVFPDNPRGKTLTYLKDVRVGSLCDSDETKAMFDDRWGAPNDLKNYCCPFLIQM